MDPLLPHTTRDQDPGQIPGPHTTRPTHPGPPATTPAGRPSPRQPHHPGQDHRRRAGSIPAVSTLLLETARTLDSQNDALDHAGLAADSPDPAPTGRQGLAAQTGTVDG